MVSDLLVTAAMAGAAVGMVVYHTLNARITSVAIEEVMTESGGGLQTMAERLLQLEGRRSFEGKGLKVYCWVGQCHASAAACLSGNLLTGIR